MFPSDDKRLFLPGETTHGHYQIELSCSECHNAGKGVQQDACIRCHGEEMKRAQDSHPKSKFSDPTKSHLLKQVKADECIACHTEHNPDATHTMGVTLPMNYCGFCHQEVGDNRPSHKGLEFKTCATAGCHNYHDNRALYERFLQKHASEPEHTTHQMVMTLSTPRSIAKPLTAADHDAPATAEWEPAVLEEWANGVHAMQGVNCTACHNTEQGEWMQHPAPSACSVCHEDNVKGWMAGRHGMRVGAGLSPMTPETARLPMNPHVLHRELDCASCHGGHSFDTRFAAVDACLHCHADVHSLAYKNSPHFSLWQAELSGAGAAGSGVSCATCHMPRIKKENGRVGVQHNQNDNLRPNEKMVRAVCMNCHGVEYSLKALADPELAPANYTTAPTAELKTMEWIRTRMVEIEARRKAVAERRSKASKTMINEDDL